MRKPILVVVVLMLVMAFAPAALAAPADGNGNKLVEALTFDFPLDCGGTFVDVHVDGWSQFREFQGEGNRNLEITVFHIDVTYTLDGETFTYRDRGPDHLYFNQDGDLILTITGRPGGVFDGTDVVALSGTAVINLDTGDIELRGNVSPNGDEQGCAALV